MNLIVRLLMTCLIFGGLAVSGWCEEAPKTASSAKSVNYQAVVKESLDQLVAAYEAKNGREFMALISESFTGDSSQFDSSIRRQFSRFTNMSIRYTFNNVTFDGKGKIFAAITYTKGYTDVKTGKQEKRQGQSSMVFTLENGSCLLYTMNKPALFGLK